MNAKSWRLEEKSIDRMVNVIDSILLLCIVMDMSQCVFR